MSQQHTPGALGHETSDARVAPLIGFLALLALGCFLALVGMRWLFGALDGAARARDLPGHPLAEQRPPVPGPRLQADPPAENAAFAATQRRLLESYGWIDRDAGVVRLPVERALELVLEQGLPTRAPGGPARGGAPGR